MLNLLHIKNDVKINATGIRSIVGYRQLIHHSGSEENILLIDLLFTTNGEEKAVLRRLKSEKKNWKQKISSFVIKKP